MANIGSSELFLLFVVALLVLGPERLPQVARHVGRWVGRARRMAEELRRQLEREVSRSEAEGEVGPDVPRPGETASKRVRFEPDAAASGAQVVESPCNTVEQAAVDHWTSSDRSRSPSGR